MGFLSDLPIEEQQRLDQMYQQRLDQPALDMQGGTRTGLDSMFDDMGNRRNPRAPMVAAPRLPERISTAVQEVPRDFQQYEQARLDAQHYRKDSPQGLGTNLTSLMGQPVTSLPRPDVMRPAVMPQPEVFKPIGGKGGNFLNRFERLLEGLEGLVGKLGGDSKPDPSPLVDPAGGIGSISPISTPFTPSQDY